MGRVVVVGSVNMDVVAQAPHHPVSGETVLATGLSFVPGGKGANQAVAASRLGAPTELVARVGDDAFGATTLQFLTEEKVTVTRVNQTETAPTGTALIVVDGQGENTIVVAPAANHTLTADDIVAIPFGPGDVVVVQLEIPLEVAEAVLVRAVELGARGVLNPAPAQAAPASLLATPDFLVLNQGELAFYAPTADVDTALRTLQQRPDQVLIATLGAAGAAVLAGDEVFRLPGHEVPVVDTTGAGDCFVGALAAALCTFADLHEAVVFANLAASLAVQRHGAGTGMPYLRDVEGLA